MVYCLHEDTLIATTNGYKTIKELSIEYGMDKEFMVYSYDHSKKEIVPAFGKQARKTRTDHAFKVIFDNGKEIIGTDDHRLMLRDGSYCKIKDLKTGDSMMPFYRKSLFSKISKNDPNHYQHIYTGKKWISEHRLIAEFVAERKLEKNEVVHHINFKKSDNRPENLKIMNNDAHSRLHREIFNGKKWDFEKNKEWIEKFRKNHSEFMKNNNPTKRDDVTFANILQVAEQCNFHSFKTAKILDISISTIKARLRENSFKNWEDFAKSYNPKWKNAGSDNTGNKNPRWDFSLTFQDVCNAFEIGITPIKLARKLNTTRQKITGRVKQNGFKNIYEFCKTYDNCKVVSVEYYGIIDLYDLTVDGYKNFATDSVISHNTPEIASALDVYR